MKKRPRSEGDPVNLVPASFHACHLIRPSDRLHGAKGEDVPLIYVVTDNDIFRSGKAYPPGNPETGFLDGPIVPMDIAKIAEGYGAKGYTIHNKAELLAALEDSKKENRVCVFDMKVAHGSMTPGYESWWRVGVAEVAKDQRVVNCWKDMQKHIAEARDY